jgi:hypothetical protein
MARTFPEVGPAANAHRLHTIASALDLSDRSVRLLRSLEGYDITVVADDSGSMRTPVDSPSADAFAVRRTRWDELREAVALLAGLFTCLDDDGIDVFFLNRMGARNVRDGTHVAHLFEAPPAGRTPLVRTLRSLSEEKRERKQLVVVFTDGVPDEGISELRQLLREYRTTAYSFIACTDDKEVMSQLNSLDREFSQVDVTDDYHTTRQQVLKFNPGVSFSLGDYVVKAIVGAVNPEVDVWGERRSGGCCAVM